MYHVLVDDFGVDVPHIASANSREFAKKDDNNEMRVLMNNVRALYHYNPCSVCWENENCMCDMTGSFVKSKTEKAMRSFALGYTDI